MICAAMMITMPNNSTSVSIMRVLTNVLPLLMLMATIRVDSEFGSMISWLQ